jgi:4-alpha-glucanotransferase
MAVSAKRKTDNGRTGNPDRMMPRRFLRTLAAQVGILPAYIDQAGQRRSTTDRTRVALLRAMGIEAHSESAARAALAALRAQAAAHIVTPVRVTGAPGARVLALGAAARGARTWNVRVQCEDGTQVERSGHGARRAIALPRLAPGYHRVQVELGGAAGERRAEQRLIVVPPRCPTPRERLGARSVYGLLANLYSLHSAHNWGIGDLSDLGRLIEWSADIDAAFVGVNPLHALDNRGDEISPYSPISRLYRNPLYLDVGAAPEWSELPEPRRRALAPAGVLRRLRDAERVDYETVRALKWPACQALYRVFADRHRDRDTARRRAYARYLAEQGEPLLAFATFAALQEHFEHRGVGDWRRWPAPYRDPRAAAVREFRAAHRAAIDLHCYLQFEIDRQLGAVAGTARARGMAVGVYQDLALGSSRRGSDAWAFPDLFLDRVDIGAPPDDYSPTGQNWRLPALDPRALAAGGYEYWSRLLRAALRHAGAVRIDHVLGLFRQYWIPAGASAAHGAYVRFPTEDLLGILALESQRAGALVIGEDLGTVPRGLPRRLARWGLLSTRVLYFERTRSGGFRAARTYPRRALAAANTHDLPPLAGFWAGTDLVLRRRLGLLRSDRALAAAQAQRARERRALLRRLRREHVLPSGAAALDDAALCAAVHAFLARTPAALVGLSLDDLGGERVPVNVPGVSLRRYPSWSRRMRLALEAFPADPDVARALDGLPRAKSTPDTKKFHSRRGSS